MRKTPKQHKFLDIKVSIIGDIFETKHTIPIDYFKLKQLE